MRKSLLFVLLLLFSDVALSRTSSESRVADSRVVQQRLSDVRQVCDQLYCELHKQFDDCMKNQTQRYESEQDIQRLCYRLNKIEQSSRYIFDYFPSGTSFVVKFEEFANHLKCCRERLAQLV